MNRLRVLRKDFFAYTVPRLLKLIRLTGIAANKRRGRIFSDPSYFPPPSNCIIKGDAIQMAHATTEIKKTYILCKRAKNCCAPSLFHMLNANGPNDISNAVITREMSVDTLTEKLYIPYTSS